jgi:hypothetical protein
VRGVRVVDMVWVSHDVTDVLYNAVQCNDAVVNESAMTMSNLIPYHYFATD